MRLIAHHGRSVKSAIIDMFCTHFVDSKINSHSDAIVGVTMYFNGHLNGSLNVWMQIHQFMFDACGYVCDIELVSWYVKECNQS